ncbi:MAG: asparagine synthase (glutamine-hydrolyzing) [Rhodospirillales bacterium]
MCGICGQFNFRHRTPVDPGRIRRMADAIVHRGPDDEGYFFSAGLGLGFRRLSIIDLEGGHQPMADAEEQVWVVFNGEIYNFPELRRELEEHGHVFRTQCDTEVIIHGYKQWGTDVLNRLNGMFGLAIWDERRRRLVLARDAAGIKLVYYRVEGGSVLFASEMRAILSVLERTPEVDVTAVNLFLRYRYTPSPLTIYDGIRKLAPGTMAVFENGTWREERWYRFRPDRHRVPRSDGEAREELLAIYKRALKRHLLSDVPVGLLLSGGVDSGLLLGLMSLHGRDWPGYTVGYGKGEYRDDELDDAAETARIFGGRHLRVELSRETFERALPRIVACVEEPIATSSIVPMYFVCQRAREDVKVALMGQGPDELFGGYTRHLGIRYGAAWRRIPGWARHRIESGIQRLPRNAALKRGVYALGVPGRMQRYQNALSIMPGADVDGLFHDDLLPPGAGDTVREIWSDLEPEMEGSDELGGFQVLELRSSLPDELLMYADKLSMAHSLEVRVPFLDREVVEYVEALPETLKVRRGRRKWLHREVCEAFLPRSIIARKKRGFAVDVVDAWFQSAIGSNVDDYLLDRGSRMSAFLKPAAVQRLLTEHRSGQADNHKMLFSLVVFEEWLRHDRAQVAHVPA